MRKSEGSQVGPKKSVLQNFFARRELESEKFGAGSHSSWTISAYRPIGFPGNEAEPRKRCHRLLLWA